MLLFFFAYLYLSFGGFQPISNLFSLYYRRFWGIFNYIIEFSPKSPPYFPPISPPHKIHNYLILFFEGGVTLNFGDFTVDFGVFQKCHPIFLPPKNTDSKRGFSRRSVFSTVLLYFDYFTLNFDLIS